MDFWWGRKQLSSSVGPAKTLHRFAVSKFTLRYTFRDLRERHGYAQHEVTTARRTQERTTTITTSHRPHSTHFSVGEAIEVVGRLRAERAYFTHICHDLGHAATNAQLPSGVQLAYDGLVLTI